MGSRVMIMAGGTGGHIFPALAVAEELMARGHEVSWLGTHRGMEARLVPAAGIEIDWLSVAGLRGKSRLSLLTAPFMLAKACLQAVCIMRRRRPQVVLGMGGFVAGPGGLMAWLLRTPLLIHEQNRIAGTTNRLLSRLANRILEAFPGTFPANRKAISTGNPLRSSIAEAMVQHDTACEGEALRILVLGGSQGARILNETVPAALQLLDFPVEVTHQTGTSMLETTRQAYAGLPSGATVTDFVEDMAEVYRWADLVICRSGAMTVSELAAMGKPAILVPFPQAIDDHQTWNARYLADGGAALLLPQAGLDGRMMAEHITSLALDRQKLKEMAVKSAQLARRDATERVAELCLAEASS